MGNHKNSLPTCLGRQPNTKLPSWEEAPVDQEYAEVAALMPEIFNLKKDGLTTQVVVIDFVFENIQPLKNQVYLAYLFVRARDPTHGTD